MGGGYGCSKDAWIIATVAKKSCEGRPGYEGMLG